jgi:chorismate mutase
LNPERETNGLAFLRSRRTYVPIRGIRGATTINNDQEEEVLAATRELLSSIQSANPSLQPADIGSAVFTVTQDIRSAFPAKAARQLGWDRVPMLCMQEIPVPGSLSMCIRVLLQWNTENTQDGIQHVYLHKAKQLRPDLNGQGN